MKHASDVKREIIETGKWIIDKQLTWGTSGNISVQDGEIVYITASGTNLGALEENDISVCTIYGEIVGNSKKPSKEMQMHLKIYQSRNDICSIIHASPLYTTFCACCDFPLKTKLFIESMYYDENLKRIPYFHAGSEVLASAVQDVCQQTHIILLEHHGVLVYDTSIQECCTAIEVTENVCKMNILAQQSGMPLQEISEEIVTDFLSGGYFKKRRN